MKWLSIIAVPFTLLVMVAMVTEHAPRDPHQGWSSQEVQRTFVGVKKCKTCHKKPEQGEQYAKWLDGPHAKAFETLASDKAKEYGAERGIDDPQAADECLQCHVTGHGVDPEFLGSKYRATDGVGCESCHGAGGDYYKKKTMKAITKGEVDGATLGLIIPDEQTCVKCHNDKSPGYKAFDFEKAKAKIAHPIPEATKAALKK